MRKIILMLVFLPSVLRAQISLGDYRAAVLDYSLDLKVSKNDVDKAEESVAFTRLLRLPTLSASGSYSHLLNNDSGSKDWRFYLQPQIIQTLYSGGAVSAAIEQSEISRGIAICSEEYTYLEVLYAADYAYWSVVATKRYHDAMREYVKIITTLKSVVDRRFSEGYIAKGDVLMIASRLSEAEYELVSSEQSYDVAKHNFNILRGVDFREQFATLAIKPDTLTRLLRVGISEIIERRPDFSAAELGIDYYVESKRSTNASYMPQLKLSVNATWQTLTPNISSSTHVDGAAVVDLSMPIFHFNARKKALAVAQRDIDKSVLEREMLVDNIQKEESNGWTTLQDSHAQLLNSQRSLDIASENLKISTYSYEEGVATILDVMQAQISWIQIYNNAINSEYNYLIARSLYRKITAAIE
ncbi:MAG: TolC family protein [Rikenellaceae bacterium]